MANGIYIALSGAVAQSNALDVTAGNVANAGTTGYRAERVSFGQALAGARSKDAASVQVAGSASDPTPGAMVETGNPLDLAIVGDGLFAVETPRGVRYTRAGDFRVDEHQRLVNASGHPVRAADGGTIAVPLGAGDLTVDADGTLHADGGRVGQIAVARFHPADLRREGAGLFIARGSPIEGGEPAQVRSGALESGNFNVVRGMVDLVRISRTYEALHRMIDSYREIDERGARIGNS